MNVLALLLALGAWLLQAAPEAPRDSRADIAALLKQFDALLDTHGKEDERAAEVTRTLADEFEKCGPRDQSAIAKATGRALRDPRPRPERKLHEDRLAMAAAKALGHMGDLGAKELVPALELKQFRTNDGLLEVTIEELGRTRAKIAIEPLLDMAATRRVACVRGAANGIAHFAEADGSTRKKLFEGLMRSMSSLSDEATATDTPTALVAKEIFEGARDATYSTLKGLTDATVPDIDAWRTWWNKHKHASWERKKG